MAELTLYADSTWQSPWVFHAMVALEELRVPYKLEALPMPLTEEKRSELRARALLPKVPCLADGEVWLTESSAISEYLAERFPAPAHPRIFPADIGERARARQILSWLRTSLFSLREDRPTTSVFQRPVTKPMSEKARVDASDLLAVAQQAIAPGRTTLFAEWCIADADLALMLMRLVANNEPTVPQRIVDYALAQWGRASIRRFLAFIPTTG
jgi:glutathione S-transferase